MISELVAGSACTKPPVDGSADAAIGAVACVAAPAPWASVGAGGCSGRAAVVAPPACPWLAKAARSTVASLVASALRRCTTQMLPPGPPPGDGRSRRAMAARSACSRAWLGARTISELLRLSATTDVPPAAAAVPGAAAGEASARRCTSAATSAATACSSGTISKSVDEGWSSAAMIVPRRCRFSA